MENKIFSIIAIGTVLNIITVSLIANCYLYFMNNSGCLTHINKCSSVLNIHGY